MESRVGMSAGFTVNRVISIGGSVGFRVAKKGAG